MAGSNRTGRAKIFGDQTHQKLADNEYLVNVSFRNESPTPCSRLSARITARHDTKIVRVDSRRATIVGGGPGENFVDITATNIVGGPGANVGLIFNSETEIEIKVATDDNTDYAQRANVSVSVGPLMDAKTGKPI